MRSGSAGGRCRPEISGKYRLHPLSHSSIAGLTRRGVQDGSNLLEDRDDLRVKMSTRIPCDDGQCLGLRHRFFVGSFRGQCVENVDDCEYPGGKGNRVAEQAIGIACAVKMLVMMTNGQRRTLQPRVARNDFYAQERMSLHDIELVGSQLAGFQQDVVRDADLANIVQECANDQIRNLRFRHAHRLGKSDRIKRYPVVVGIRVRIPLGDGVSQRTYELECRGPGSPTEE